MNRKRLGCTMRAITTPRGATTLLVVLLGLSLVPTAGATRSLEIERFDATLDISSDGVVHVEERITVDFRGSWNGIFRDIPYGYVYPWGIRGKIRLSVTGIEDAEGNSLEYARERGSGQLRLKIRVPGARDARRTVVIRYDAEGVIRRTDASDVEYGLHDELYWNVTGNGWQVPIRRASAEVRLPEGISDEEVRAVAYTGRSGSRDRDCEIRRLSSRVVRFETTRVLNAHSGLTVAVGFPPDRVDYPSVLGRADWFLRANWHVLVPLGMVLLWWLFWWYRGRDPLKDRIVVPEWEPPSELRPSEVGVLIDDRMDQRDLTASIFDLAVRGVLTIRETGGSRNGNRDFVLALNEHLLDGAKLETFEQALIDGLFGGKSEVTLSSLKRRFFDKVGRVRSKVLDDLVVKGLFRARPDKVQRRWLILTLNGLIGMVGFGLVFDAPSWFWIAMVLALPPMVVFSWKMPRRTKAGLDALARVKGLEEYLVNVERERLEELSLGHVERLLPYAIALDLHDRWTAAFAGLFERPPDWYRVPDGSWEPAHMGSVVGEMNRSVRNNLYSVPRTRSTASGWSGGFSGGSGFSGGGSSGGGFGGGGGGGW